MAQALMTAIVNDGTVDRDSIYLYDIDNLKRDKLRAEGYTMVKSEAEVVKSADIIFLTVRPSDLKKVLTHKLSKTLDTLPINKIVFSS